MVDVEDDGFLRDLVAFLDAEEGEAHAQHVLTVTGGAGARRRVRSEQQLKALLEGLRGEAKALADQLERMRGETRSGAMEAALLERLRRRRAEEECQRLRDAVYAQARFLRGFRTMFMTPSSCSPGLNVCQYLHNYTRLPRDRHTRWSEYASLAQEARLRTAMDILCHETEALSLVGGMPSTSDPIFHAEVVPAPNGFGVTATSVFAVDAHDISTVLRAASVAVYEIIATCPVYKCTLLTKKIVDPDASLPLPGSSIHYRVVGSHHKTQDGHELSIGTRMVTLFKQAEDHAMLLWDYIDDDELHPALEVADFTREAVGVCLIRREMCADGVERPVYRALSTRRYRLNENGSRDVLSRFHCEMERAKIANEVLFRGIMLREVAKEEAAYANAMGLLRQA